MDSIILKKRYSAWHPTCQCTIYPSTFTWVLPIERRKCSSTASRIQSWKATTCGRSSRRRPPLIRRCFSISYCRRLFSTLDTVWRGDTSSRILERFWHLRFLERSFQHFSSGNLLIPRFMTLLFVLIILLLQKWIHVYCYFYFLARQRVFFFHWLLVFRCHYISHRSR